MQWNHIRFGVLALSALCLSGGLCANASSAEAPQKVAVIMGFAYQSEAASDANEFTLQACREANMSTNPEDKLDLDRKTLDTLSDELEARLAKKAIVMSYLNPRDIPVGAVVISGCVFRSDGGNVAGKMVGMNLGASQLAVHILFQIKTNSGFLLLDSYDEEVKGGSKLPPLGPIGLAVHAVRLPSQTIEADAKKLSGRIAKKLAEDLKQNQALSGGGQ